MTTNFFTRIAALKAAGDLKINIQTQNDNQLLVSVLVTNEKVNDDAKKMIPPLVFKGTPQELDEAFFATIEKPIQKTSNLFVNMESFEKAIEEAQRKSKMEKEKEDKEKKEKEEQKKKYDAQMKKVADLEEKEKYGEAIAAMPKADQFPEQEEEIKKKQEELRKKHGQL